MDWSKGTVEIANELGCSEGCVLKYRMKYAPDTVKVEGHLSSGVDWSKSNADIASEEGVDISTVRRRRWLDAPDEFQNGRENLRYDVDWTTVDWENNRNVDIASELKVPDTLVSVYRQRLAPHTVRPKARGRHNWLDVMWSKPDSQIAQELDTTEGYVYHKRRQYAPDTVTTPHKNDWKNVDWSKRNSAIAKEMNVGFSAAYRNRKAKEIVDKLIGGAGI